MKIKRIVSALLCASMLVFGAASCNTETGSDLEYVKEKGTLVVGITNFAPMDYQDASGNWVGFDADMAKAYAESLGVEVEFLVLSAWNNKHIELQTRGVDVVWNGMTITDEVKGLMGVSDAYCMNAQVVVMKSDIASQYTTEDSLKSLTFAVEDGSAGAEALDALNIQYTAVVDQARALTEVASGSAQACVIDLLMAGAMIGEGTSYPDLVTGIELTTEEYGVGFRKDSDLIANFNDFWKKAYDDGTVMKTAENYGIAKNIIAK